MLLLILNNKIKKLTAIKFVLFLQKFAVIVQFSIDKKITQSFIINIMQLLSIKLIREVLKEAKYLPYHAYKVSKGRVKSGVYPHEKYTFGSKKNQYLCWFEPAEVLHDKIIIFYHGGGWTFGTPELFSDRAKIFVELGYRVIMPAHRKLPKNRYPQIRQDLELTLKKIESILDKKKIINQKIIVGGMSSGGNLAGLLLFDQTLWQTTNFKAKNFGGGFFCGAPLNLAGMTDSFLLANYAGRRNTDSFNKASPITHLPTMFNKPILVVHGTNDGLVNYQGTAEFVEKLKAINQQTTDFHIIEKGSHLKAVSWAYEENEVKRRIINWLESV